MSDIPLAPNEPTWCHRACRLNPRARVLRERTQRRSEKPARGACTRHIKFKLPFRSRYVVVQSDILLSCLMSSQKQRKKSGSVAMWLTERRCISAPTHAVSRPIWGWLLLLLMGFMQAGVPCGDWHDSGAVLKQTLSRLLSLSERVRAIPQDLQTRTWLACGPCSVDSNEASFVIH
jgi:hypothetical protein